MSWLSVSPMFRRESLPGVAYKERCGLVALTVNLELVAAVVVGTTMGYILDSWFDTKPLFIISFFIIGVVAGIRNVFRAAKRMEKN